MPTDDAVDHDIDDNDAGQEQDDAGCDPDDAFRIHRPPVSDDVQEEACALQLCAVYEDPLA